MFVDLAASLASTARRRLTRGPLRPSWSFLFEVSIGLLRRTSQRAAGLDPLAERALWSTMKAPTSPVFRGVVRKEAQVGGVPASCVEPQTPSSELVVLYVHGGSFIYGSPESHAELVAHLAVASGARIFSLDYRLAPEHPFPAAQDDLLTAFRGLVAAGTLPERVVFAGDSAGGNLVLTALLRLRDEGAVLPAGVIAISPWVDLSREGGSLVANQGVDWGIAEAFTRWARVYRPEGDLQDPLVSPLFGNFAGAPPILLLSGECEMLRDQLDEFAARARAAGADLRDERYTDMVHGWMTLPSLTPEGPRAFEVCGAFVRELEARATGD